MTGDQDISCPECKALVHIVVRNPTIRGGRCTKCNTIMLGRRKPDQPWSEAQMEFTRRDGTKGFIRGEFHGEDRHRAQQRGHTGRY